MRVLILRVCFKYVYKFRIFLVLEQKKGLNHKKKFINNILRCSKISILK